MCNTKRSSRGHVSQDHERNMKKKMKKGGVEVLINLICVEITCICRPGKKIISTCIELVNSV